MKKAVCFMLLLCAAGPVPAADAPRRLTLREAEDIALAQHPRISFASLIALAAQQSVKESRAAFFPNIYASGTAVGVADTNNTRIAAGYLNNPNVYERTGRRPHHPAAHHRFWADVGVDPDRQIALESRGDEPGGDPRGDLARSQCRLFRRLASAGHPGGGASNRK